MPPSIGLKSMQNSTFLVLLNKNSHPNGLGSRSCEGLAVIWTWEVDFFFLERTQVSQQKRLNFGEDLLFGHHLISAGITDSILVMTFFWGVDHLILTKKPPQSDSRLMKIWVKFVYCWFHLWKRPPSLRNHGYAPLNYNYNYWLQNNFNYNYNYSKIV